MSGGEFLRGVLEESMLFHELAIYTIELVVPAGPPSFPLSAVLPLKQDRFFLAASAELKQIAVNNVVTDLSYNLAEIYNPATSFVYDNKPSKPAFLGGNANAPYQFADYILFKPPGMIGFRIQNNATQGTPLTAGATVCLSLYGVEYGLG